MKLILGFIAGFVTQPFIREIRKWYQLRKFNRASCPECKSIVLAFYDLQRDPNVLICLDCKKTFNPLKR